MRSTQVNFKHVARIDEMVRSDLLCIFLHLHTPDFSNGCLVGGFNPSEKYEFVSWDDYFQYMEKNKIHVPNHQADVIFASQPFNLGVFGSFKRLSKVQPVKSHHLIPGFSWPILEHQNS